MTRTTPPTDIPTATRRRRPALVAVAGAVLVALVAVLLWSTGRGDAGGAAEATATAAAAPTSSWTPPPAPVTPEPTGPTSDANSPPPELPAVALSGTAAVGNGVTASVTGTEGIDGTGNGVGNVAGPALRVTVRIDNGTAGPVSLDAVDVTLAHGSERTPASPLEDPSQAPFTGTVEAGESATGVYVFSIPPEVRDVVTLTVGYQAGAPLLVFTGSAA